MAGISTYRECPCCGELRPDVEVRRRNTAYVDDDLNYLESCLLCYEGDCQYFDELWAMYWSDR